MSHRTMEVVVCDLCKVTRPAKFEGSWVPSNGHGKPVSMDLCTTHFGQIKSPSGETLTCPDCGRTGFTSSLAVSIHRSRGHGIVSKNRQARASAAKRKTTKRTAAKRSSPKKRRTRR